MKSFREQTYYEVLELPPTATEEEIRAAHRRLTEQFGDDAVAMYGLAGPAEAKELRARLLEAMEILTEPELRVEYDRQIGLPARSAPKPPAPPALEEESSAPKQLAMTDLLSTIEAMHSTHPEYQVSYIPRTSAAEPMVVPPDAEIAPPRPSPAMPPAADVPAKTPASDAAPAELAAPAAVPEAAVSAGDLAVAPEGSTPAPPPALPDPSSATTPEVSSPARAPDPAAELVAPAGAPDPIASTSAAPPADPVSAAPAVAQIPAAAKAPAPAKPPAAPPLPSARARMAAAAAAQNSAARVGSASAARAAPKETLNVAPQIAQEAAIASAEAAMAQASAKAREARPAALAEARPKPAEIPPDAEFNGELLRQVRQSRNISLEQLAERTRIIARHLGNVEADRYDALPATVYLRGILMNIARELGLDPLRVSKSYLGLVGSARKQ